MTDKRLEGIATAVEATKGALSALLYDQSIEDLAFIGNASAIYEWLPCPMVDLDCFLFAKELNESLGRRLVRLQAEVSESLALTDIAFEVRIVEGPYKPAIAEIERPIVVAHLGAFTEESYRASPHLKRWAWRKYRCERRIERLAELAGSQPTIDEFVEGAKGLNERLGAIRAGAVIMTEWCLPDLAAREFVVAKDSVGFQECCFAYAANTARNHCRARGDAEADQLGNEAFFAWYDANVFQSKALLELMDLKTHCRIHGFDQDTEHVRHVTLQYLEALRSNLGDPAPGSA